MALEIGVGWRADGLEKIWFVGGSRAVVGYRAASEFPDADIADIGNSDDERLSSCGVAAGGVH